MTDHLASSTFATALTSFLFFLIVFDILYRPIGSLVSSGQKCCLRNGPSLSRQNNNCRHRAYLLPASKNCRFLFLLWKRVNQPSLYTMVAFEKFIQVFETNVNFRYQQIKWHLKKAIYSFQFVPFLSKQPQRKKLDWFASSSMCHITWLVAFNEVCNAITHTVHLPSNNILVFMQEGI